MSLQNANLFITGGTGSLGNALVKHARAEKWTGKIAVFSRDPIKQLKMKAIFPDIQYILGDVADFEGLKLAMTGYDIVFHLAAMKHIPQGEIDSIATLNTNLNGTINACEAALYAGVRQFAFVSTDKACNPYNLYGMSKAVGEKVVQEYARIQDQVSFHLIRYGNVLESTGSVIELWKNALERGEKIKITDPEMTRFWLSPQEAVDHVLASMNAGSGIIFVPRMPALSIGKLATYSTGASEWDRIPLRPGEKIHETLVTEWELRHAEERTWGYLIYPTWADYYPKNSPKAPYSSDMARELTKEELWELLKDE